MQHPRARWLLLFSTVLSVLASTSHELGQGVGEGRAGDGGIRGHTATTHREGVTTPREQQIARFLVRRSALSPLCLYTFDRAVNRTPLDASSDATELYFENHAPDCPFGDLEFDRALVTTLNVDEHSWQLGIRIADEAGDRRRVQIASTGFAYARDFYTMAVAASEPEENNEHPGGVTFEMALRRTSTQQRRDRNSSDSAGNRTSDAHMTLFSIANLYDGCVDPGFRVDVDSDRMLVLVYYLPVEDINEQPACYEQLLLSSSEDAFFERHHTKCQLPEVMADEDDNPPVYIAVTIDPSGNKGIWHTEFLLSYVDPATLKRVRCNTFSQKSPPLQTRLLNERVTGNFRLYIGNSPRTASSQKERRVKAAARRFRPLSSQDQYKNATERLRATLLDKLMSIKGPRIPEAMRIFGDKSFALTLFGVEFPPVNEDTPLAYLRGKLRDFLVTNGGKIVDHLVEMLRKVQPVVEEPDESIGEHIMQRTIAQLQQQNATASTEYADAAHASSFDLFHFAIYRKALAPRELADTSWPHLGPFRPLPTLTQELHIAEDELASVDLVLLHSVYDDAQLELRELPEFGRLLLFPSKAVVTAENMTSFRELPPEFQKMIYFQPNENENNENLPLPYSFAFARRTEPYSVVKFGLVESRTGRKVDTTATASISIFVDPVNDAPRPLLMEQLVVLDDAGVPVQIDLKGVDADGSPRPASSSGNRSDDESKKTLLDDIADRITATLAPAPPPRQFVRVSRLPCHGRLYDIHSTTQNESLQLPIGLERGFLEKYRISVDDIDNRTFSTSLLYVYGGWNRISDSENRLGEETGIVGQVEDQPVVDELQYQLNDGEAGVFSDVAVVKFVLNTRRERRTESNCLKIVRLQEDSSIALTLADIEPLIGFLHPRTRFVITKFPKHGALYQFHEDDIRSERDGKELSTHDSVKYRVGRKLDNTSRSVNDVHGRLVYIPERDYYNVLPEDKSTHATTMTRIELDSFAFEPANLNESHELFETWTASGDSSERRTARNHSLPFNALQPRVVQIQVVSEPDELVLLPPVSFVANPSNGNATLTPVRFEDPDALYDGKYLATVKAKGGLSRFVLGVNVSSEDVMKFCNATRPCLLPRSLNKSRTGESQTQGEDGDDRKITFIIQHMIFTPFHVTVIGNRNALQHALSEMTFSAWGATFLAAHREQFTVKISRINDKFETADKQSATAIYYVDFPPLLAANLGEVVGQAVRKAVSQLHEFIWTLLVSALVCMLIMNPSCFSGGISCCCCCTRGTRERRRRAFEEEQIRFRSQVAQNDYEYSMLLLDIADMVLEPDLVFATSLVRAIYGVADSQSDGDDAALLRMFCVRTLIPVLESERQTTRLVFRLMVLEFEEAERTNQAAPSPLQSGFLGGSSCAGHVLKVFCRGAGEDWLKGLVVDVVTEFDVPIDQDHDNQRIGRFISRMHRALADLPVEVVILCRACVKLFVGDENAHRSASPLVALYRAVHLVFFSHFVGPALCFEGDNIVGVSIDHTQRRYLHGITYSLVELTRHWDTHEEEPDEDAYISLMEDEEVRREQSRRSQLREYEALIHSIATSPGLQSSYDASASSVVELQDVPGESSEVCRVDSDLMALCLANIHSLLDSYISQFEAQHDALNLQRQQHHVESVIVTPDRLPRLRRLLRALSFPPVSVGAMLERLRRELSADRLWSGDGFSAREWTEFVDEQINETPQHRVAIQNSTNKAERETGARALGRSQSLLSVNIGDNLELDYDANPATSRWL